MNLAENTQFKDARQAAVQGGPQAAGVSTLHHDRPRMTFARIQNGLERHT